MEQFLANNASSVVTILVVAAFFLRIQRDLRAASGQGEKREIANQPLMVALQREFVAHEEFRREIERVDKDVVSLGGKLDGFHKDLAQEGSRRASTIHKRVDELAKEVTAATTTGEQTNSQIIMLGQKVDTLINDLRKEGGRK